VRLIHALVPILVVAQASISACVRKNDAFTPQVEPVYDTTTGKLRLLQYDSNGEGKIDAWSYMNGSQVVRIEVDRDGDGRVDQWQYYEGSQKVGFNADMIRRVSADPAREYERPTYGASVTYEF
jgi:hypothetical protein